MRKAEELIGEKKSILVIIVTVLGSYCMCNASCRLECEVIHWLDFLKNAAAALILHKALFIG